MTGQNLLICGRFFYVCMKETKEEYKNGSAATIVADAATAAAKAVRDTAVAAEIVKEKPLTWLQFNNILPIVTSAVMIALSFAALNTRLTVVENKLDTVIASQQELSKVLAAKLYDIETRYGNLTLKVQALETMHSK